MARIWLNKKVRDSDYMDSQGMFHLKRKADVFHIPSLPSAVQGLPAAASPILRQKPDHWREGLKAASKIQRSRFQTAQMCSPQQTTPPSCRASRNALATVVEMLWLQSIPTWFLNMLCDVTNFCRAERPQDLLILYYTGLWTLITWKIKIYDFPPAMAKSTAWRPFALPAQTTVIGQLRECNLAH